MLSEFFGHYFFFHSRAAAEAAKPLLTKKVYGVQYGVQEHSANFLKELGFKHIQERIIVGSPDSFFPKGFRFSTIHNVRENHEIQWNSASYISSVEELIHVLRLQTQKYNKDREQQYQNFAQQKQNQWSSQHIATLLNLDANEREQLEGSVVVGLNAPLGIVSFDNRTIEQLTGGKPNLR